MRSPTFEARCSARFPERSRPTRTRAVSTPQRYAPAQIPVIDIFATSATAKEAITLADETAEAFKRYILQQQNRARSEPRGANPDPVAARSAGRLRDRRAVVRDPDAHRDRRHRGLLHARRRHSTSSSRARARASAAAQQPGRAERPGTPWTARRRYGPTQFRSSRSSARALIALCAGAATGGDAAAAGGIAFFVATLIGLGQTAYPLVTWPNALAVFIGGALVRPDQALPPAGGPPVPARALPRRHRVPRDRLRDRVAHVEARGRDAGCGQAAVRDDRRGTLVADHQLAERSTRSAARASR